MTERQIPRNHAEAIAALVALDVARWGETERAASEELNRRNYPTYGLALNSLAHRREYDYGDGWMECVAAAKHALSASDRAQLRKGG